jgi:hypothetical protein
MWGYRGLSDLSPFSNFSAFLGDLTPGSGLQLEQLLHPDIAVSCKDKLFVKLKLKDSIGLCQVTTGFK